MLEIIIRFCFIIGFNAVVHKEPLAAKAIVAAPAIAKVGKYKNFHLPSFTNKTNKINAYQGVGRQQC